MPRPLVLLLTAVVALIATGCDEVPDLSLPNEPPIARDDNVNMLQDAVADIEIGENDTDIDGNVDTIEIISDATHGTTEVIGNFVRYIPERLFIGTDTFDYRITDVEGENDSASVTITVKQRQSLALFSLEHDGLRRLYMLDTRAPGTVTDMSATLDATESVRDWAYHALRREAVMLTDADRIIRVPLEDPQNPLDPVDIELANGETANDGFDVSALADQAAFTVNNQVVRTYNFSDGAFASVDTGFANSTMQIEFFSPVGTSVIMSGTINDPPQTAFYLQTLAGLAPTQFALADNADETVSAQVFPATNQMVWVTETAGDSGTAPFSCQTPPPQRVSALNYVSLLQVNTVVDLNAASGLLGAPTNIISYNPTPSGANAFVAACPPMTEQVQLIEIPYADPSTARVIASGDDASDALYTVDVSASGQTLIYVVEGDTGLRPVRVDLSDTDPVLTDLAADIPLYQASGNGAPPSAITGDEQRWVFVAPVNDSPTRLVWVELDGLASATTDLPFAVTEDPVSDGFNVLLSAPGTTESTFALAPLDGTPVSEVTLPGALATSDTALATPDYLLVPVLLEDTP